MAQINANLRKKLVLNRKKVRG